MMEGEGVTAAGVRGPLSLEDVLFAAAKAGRVAPLQVVRHDLVVGMDHVRSAALHATRAFREGRSHAKNLEVEFTRYLAGERQIRVALEKVGLRDGAPAAVVVALGDKCRDGVRYFVDYLGLVEDDALLAATDDKLAAFGITPEAQATVPRERRFDLVLEAVAAVDLMR